MQPTQILSLVAQTWLKKNGYYQGALDAKWGPFSKKAAARWFTANRKSLPDVVVTEEVLRILAAQCHLADLGLYTGKVDGEWGPLSQAAAAEWAAAGHAPAAPPPAPEPAPVHASWSLSYDIAKRYLGTREIPGKKNNPLIVRWLRQIASWVSDDETAWCSAFVNHCAEEAGYERSGKLNARSWLDVGQSVPVSESRKGDVVILWRGTKNGWEGHVAFLDHYNPVRGLVYLLGGNQNNEVNITAYPVGRVLGVRRLRSLESLQGKTANRIV